MWISEYTIHTQYNHNYTETVHYTCIDLYICLGWSVATMIFVIRMLKMFWTRDKIKWFSQCMTIAWHLSMISIVCTLIKNGKLVNQIATLQLIVVKISQLTSNHLYQHLHTYNHVSRWPSSPLPAIPHPPPSFPTLKIITYHTPALVYFIFEWQRKMKWIWWWKHHFFCQHIIQPVCCDYSFSIWNCLNTNTLHIILLK